MRLRAMAGGASMSGQRASVFGQKNGLPFKAVGAFQAAARPLVAVLPGHRRSQGSAGDQQQPASATEERERASLAELSEGPYFIIAMMLDAGALCRSDATCRLLRALNRANAGPWRTLGARVFRGMELDREGIFEAAEELATSPAQGFRKHARVDWKGRYAHYRSEVPTFRPPFVGREITSVINPDEVAYGRCRLRSDLLDSSSDAGVYLEVEVLTNPDNLSLAVVDFEAGGRSSVTFSPDTGAVIRERKVRESPRKVEGAYIQPLSTTRPGRRFEGSVGLYILSGHLAFFRRCAQPDSSAELPSGGGRDQQAAPESRSQKASRPVELGPWESTGFITDLTWAEGRRLTPCLAFRDEGMYHVRVARFSNDPPQPPGRMSTAYEDGSWSGLDWEAETAA